MTTQDIAIVDLSAIWYRMWHGTATKPLDESQKNTLGKIRRIAERHQHCVVALDRPPYDRRKDYPAYKAQRDEDTEQMKGQRQDTIDELRAEGFYLLEHPGCEADDMIASCVGALAAVAETDFREHGDTYQITVYSADKDLLALRCVAEAGGPLPCQVRIVSTEGACDKELSPEEKWCIPPAMVRHLLAMAGDTADHIPGIRGVGEGKAAKLCQAGLGVPALVGLVREKKPFEIAAELPEGMGEACAAAIVAAVMDGSLETALQLTTLRTDAPVDVDCIFAAREPAATDGDDYGMGGDPENYGMGGDEESEPGIASVETAVLQSAEPPSSKPEPERAPPAEPTQPESGHVPQNPLEVKRKRKPRQPSPMTSAIVVHEAEWDTSFEPRNRDEAWNTALMVRNSRLFAGYGRPEQVMLAIMAGRQRGMSVVDSLNGFDIIEGHVAPRAQLMMAWVLNSPVCEQFEYESEESDDTIAVFTVKRRGWARAKRVTYTIERAERAGLTGKTNWRYADDMLMNRCAGFACHAHFPDVVRCMNSIEELEGIQDDDE